MIKITLPDNSVKEFDKGVTGLEIAEAISSRLAKEVLSISVNGEVRDLTRAIDTDASIKLHLWDDIEGRTTFWHSSAHLMAEAIESSFPGTKFGIGPTVDNGFYYDIDLPEGKVLSDKDLAGIEQKMLELARTKEEITRSEISKADALKLFTEKGDPYKIELITDLQDGTITTYHQGNFTDLCRGPHLPNMGFIKAIKLTSIAGAYWRGNEKNKMLTRVYGITFRNKNCSKSTLFYLKKQRKGITARSGKRWNYSLFLQLLVWDYRFGYRKEQSYANNSRNFLRKYRRNSDTSR